MPVGRHPYGDHIKIVLTATDLLYDLDLYSVTFRAGRSHKLFPQNVVVEFWADTGSGLSLRQTSAAFALNKSTAPSNNNVGGLYTFDFSDLSGIRTPRPFYVHPKTLRAANSSTSTRSAWPEVVPEPRARGCHRAFF